MTIANAAAMPTLIHGFLAHAFLDFREGFFPAESSSGADFRRSLSASSACRLAGIFGIRRLAGNAMVFRSLRVFLGASADFSRASRTVSEITSVAPDSAVPEASNENSVASASKEISVASESPLNSVASESPKESSVASSPKGVPEASALSGGSSVASESLKENSVASSFVTGLSRASRTVLEIIPVAAAS